MNTIKELKAKEKYDNMLKRKNKEIERLNNIINEQDKELELERKSRQLLTDDLANVCEMSLKKENIINKAIEYCKELMLFKKNSRQYLIGKCMLENLRRVDKDEN